MFAAPYFIHPISGIWTSVYSPTLNNDDANGANVTTVRVIPANTFAANGSQVRLTLAAASNGNANVASMYMGHAALSGNAYNFDGTQVQVTIGASGTFSITQNTTALTDAVAYAVDRTKVFLIAYFESVTNNVRTNFTGDGTSRYWSSVNEAGTTLKSAGYTLDTVLDFISKIEVLV